MSISIIKHKPASDTFTYLHPSLLIFTSLGLMRATQTDPAASQYDLWLPSLLCKRGPLEAPDHSYPACVCVLHLSQRRVLPHITERRHWGKTTKMLWRTSKWHESWLLLCSSPLLFLLCVSPRSAKSDYSNFPKTCHFLFLLLLFFFFGGGARITSVLCVCWWALSGVLVMMRVELVLGVLTNWF